MEEYKTIYRKGYVHKGIEMYIISIPRRLYACIGSTLVTRQIGLFRKKIIGLKLTLGGCTAEPINTVHSLAALRYCTNLEKGVKVPLAV
mgnify:CR=1 FL=1